MHKAVTASVSAVAMILHAERNILKGEHLRKTIYPKLVVGRDSSALLIEFECQRRLDNCGQEWPSAEKRARSSELPLPPE